MWYLMSSFTQCKISLSETFSRNKIIRGSVTLCITLCGRLGLPFITEGRCLHKYMHLHEYEACAGAPCLQNYLHSVAKGLLFASVAKGLPLFLIIIKIIIFFRGFQERYAHY